MRDLATLPKAHLHLHFTGSMRHATLLELAERDGLLEDDRLLAEELEQREEPRDDDEGVVGGQVGQRQAALLGVGGHVERRAVRQVRHVVPAPSPQLQGLSQ